LSRDGPHHAERGAPTRPRACGSVTDWIEFKARFGGVAREILVPVERVEAIFARENQQGLGFQVVDAPAAADTPALAVAEAPSAGQRKRQSAAPPTPAPRPDP
jgi:stringent starvation protein B